MINDYTNDNNKDNYIKANKIAAVYLRAKLHGYHPVLLTKTFKRQLWEIGNEYVKNFICDDNAVSYIYILNNIPYYHNVNIKYVTGIGIRELKEVHWFYDKMGCDDDIDDMNKGRYDDIR